MEEQIAYSIHQAESGTSISDFCRQLEIAEQTIYGWKKKYVHSASANCASCAIGGKNSRLKRLVVDLSPDKRMLSEALGT